jgi:hypothetical protein
MSKRFAVQAVGAAALALGLGLAIQPAASAAASVTASPSTGLASGTTVTVNGAGLKPSTPYHVGECVEVHSGQSSQLACNKPGLVHLTSDASGKLTTPLTVYSSFEGYLLDGSAFGTVNCKVSTCAVTVGDDTGQGAAARISFR